MNAIMIIMHMQRRKINRHALPWVPCADFASPVPNFSRPFVAIAINLRERAVRALRGLAIAARD